MYGRPWYIQATDVAHRLFVLSIIGGSAWIAGGLTLTLWANRESARRDRVEFAQQNTAPKVRPGDVETEISREALASLAARENGNNNA